MTSSTSIPEDDLLLHDSIEVSQSGASLEALAKGNKKIPGKRKGGSFSIPYYRARRRINSESISSHGLSFFDRCKNFQDLATLNHEAWDGDLMFSDCHANILSSTTDLIEDGSHKLTENICPLLTDNLMDFFEVDIDPKDDTHMHKTDSDNSSAVTEVEYASLPDSLWSFSNKDYIPCSLNTEDSIDDILNSPLLDSPENVLEDSIDDINPKDDTHMHKSNSDDFSGVTEVDYASLPDLLWSFSNKDYILCSLNTEDSIDDILNSPLRDSPENVLEDTSFDEHQEDVCHCETDVKLSSVSHLDPFQLSDEKNICNLNTEDPDIPCNDSNFLLSHSSPTFPPQVVTDSIDPASSCSQSQMYGPDLPSEFDSAPLRVGYALESVSLDHSPSMSNHSNSESDSDLPCLPDIVSPYLSSEFDSAHPLVGYALEPVLLDHNPSMSNRNNSDSDSDPPCIPDIVGPPLSSEFDSAHPRVGYALESVSLDHNLSISESDHNNSDSDSDIRCFPDIVGPDVSSEFDSAHPRAGYALESVSLDHNPSMSNHNYSNIDSELPCVPDIVGPSLSSEFVSAHPHVGHALESVSLDRNPSNNNSDSDSDLPCLPDIVGPHLSSEFDSAHPRVGYTLESVSLDHNLSMSESDHNNSDSDSDLPCIPDIVGRSLSSEFDSAHPCDALESVSLDHNPSMSNHNNSDSENDLPCIPDIVGPHLSSEFDSAHHRDPSMSNHNSDSESELPCFLDIVGPSLSSEFDSAHLRAGYALESVSLDQNPSMSNHNDSDSESDQPCFPDIIGPSLSPEFVSAHPCVGYALESVSLDHNPSMSSHKNSDSKSELPCFSDIVGPSLSSEFDSTHPRAGYALESVSLDHNPSISNHNNSDSDSDLPCFLDTEFDSTHPHVGYALESVSLDHNPSNNNSDSDCDLHCIPDIEALIIKLDYEYAQESWITNDVKSRKYLCDKRTINRLETSSLQRALSSLGAFAVFYSYSNHFNYYIKKTEVIVGRSTDDNDVDIDLTKESHANMISRQQATIKMETDGKFTLKNTGKGSILVKGISIAQGQVAALSSNSLIQIRGMNFMFEINERYVRWYLDNIIMKDRENEAEKT